MGLRMRLCAYFLCGMVVGGTAIAVAILVFNYATDSRNVKSTISEPNQDISETSSEVRFQSPNRDVPNIGSELLDLDRIENYSDWSVALDVLLVRAQPHQLTAMLEQARDIGHHIRRVAGLQTIALRYVGIDPHKAMTSIESFPSPQRERLMETIVAEWAATDLDSLVEHAVSFGPREKEGAFRTILQVRDDLSKKRQSEFGQRLHLFELTEEIIQSHRRVSVVNSIEENWYATVGDQGPAGEKTGNLYRLAQDWVESEGVDALSKIAESLSHWQIRRSVLHIGLEHSARSDPQATFNTTLNLFEDSDWDLIREAAKLWMEREPDKALIGISDIGSNTLRRNVYEYVVRQWARNEPRNALEHLELLPEGMFDRVQFEALASLREVTPDEASRLIAGVREDGKFRLNAASSLVMQWAREDYEEALEWILSSPDVKDMRFSLFVTALRHLTPANAEQSLQSALELPAGESDEGLEALVIYQVAQHDVALAKSMVRHARNNRTKLGAQVKIGETYLEVGNSELALELANEVEESSRPFFYDGLLQVWSILDVKGAYEAIERLPSSSTRSRGAMWVLRANEFDESLSKDEVDELQAFLTDSDAQNLASGNVQVMLPEE